MVRPAPIHAAEELPVRPLPPLLLADHEDRAVAALRRQAGERVEVLVPADGDESTAVQRIAAALGSGRPLRVRRSPGAPPERRALFERVLAGALAVHGETVGTLRGRADEWLDNIVAAAAHLVSLPPVAAMDGCLAGLPALVVGAGPSLDLLLPFLPAVAERAAVLAAGSALAPLARAGIVPDVAVVVEGRDRREQLAAAHRPKRTLLVVAQHGHPAHLDPRFRGLVRLDAAENGWFAALAGPPARPFPTGGNVGTTALALALAWGADPVILAGLDFAWPAEGASHAAEAGSPPAGAEHGKFLEVPGTGDAPVRTSSLLAAYRANTEAILRQFPGRVVINPVRRGAARIAGTLELPPERLVPARPALPRPALPDPPRPAPPAPARLAAGIEALARDLALVAREAARLREAGAGTEETRAVLAALLAAHPGSFPAALMRGHLLDPAADPREVVGERLARGVDRLRALARALLPGRSLSVAGASRPSRTEYSPR